MDTMTMVLIVAGAVVIVALVVWMLAARRREHLKARFGPEYERTVRDVGSETRAAQTLEARARRVRAFRIRALTAEERSGFTERWRRLQATFVDDPGAAVGRADELVAELMNTRGYPMSDFDQRAEDLSVDHATVVHHYREAHGIALQHAGQGASTESLRQALVHYRALFEDLLDTSEPARKRA